MGFQDNNIMIYCIIKTCARSNKIWDGIERKLLQPSSCLDTSDIRAYDTNLSHAMMQSAGPCGYIKNSNLGVYCFEWKDQQHRWVLKYLLFLLINSVFK